MEHRLGKAQKDGAQDAAGQCVEGKARPSTTQPQTSMTKLNASRKPETESPVRRPKASATPGGTPGHKARGLQKKGYCQGVPALPKTTAAALSSCRL